jgi:hypothetical protein
LRDKTALGPRTELPEKPPPEWGVLCEASARAMAAISAGETPTEAGRSLRVATKPLT